MPPQLLDPRAERKDESARDARSAGEFNFASAAEPEADTPRGPADMEEQWRFQQAWQPPPRHIFTKAEVPLDAQELQDEEIPEGAVGIISDSACDTAEEVGRMKSRMTGRRFVYNLMQKDLDMSVKRARMLLRKAVLAYSATMMEREVLKEVIEEDYHRWRGCIQLPISLIFFIFYLVSVVFHESVTYTHITTLPMRTALSAALDDIVTKDDVYGFLQDTYLPFFFAQYDGLGNELPKDRWSTIGQYTFLLGAAQMELQRSTREPCQEMATFVECYPLGELTGEAFGGDRSQLPPPKISEPGSPWSLDTNRTWTWWNWGANSSSPSLSTILDCGEEGFTSQGCSGSGGGARRLLDTRFEIASTLPTPTTAGSAPTYTFHLDSRDPYARLYNRIDYLKARHWLDAQSTTLVLKAVLLNSQLGGTPRMVSVSVYFFFSRGGGVYTDLKVEGKTIEMFSVAMSYGADFCFVAILLVRTGVLGWHFVSACRRRTWRTLCNATFVIACFTVFFAYLNILMMLLQESMMQSVKENIERYFADPSIAQSSVLYGSTTDVFWLGGYARPLIAYANFFFLCQVCIALQWQPRLAVVTETLLACSSDLFHYLIVLSLTISAFALSGMVIFGRRVIEFADPVSAIGVCFKIAIESEYDWVTLSQKEWMTSFTWVVLYLLLVVMLMVNMVLAIIMDVYAEVRTHAGDSMSIFAHLQYIYRRIKYRQNWVADLELLDQVCEMPATITLLELRQAFPEMHYHQMGYIQMACENKAQMVLRVGLNKAYVSQITSAAIMGLEEIEGNLERLKHRGWMANGIEVGCDENREWVKNLFASIASQHTWLTCAAKQLNALQLRMQGTTAEEEERRRREAWIAAGRSVKQRGSMVDFGRITVEAGNFGVEDANAAGYFGM